MAATKKKTKAKPGAAAARKMAEAIRAAIQDVPDFPKKGVVFKDITPMLKEPRLFKGMVKLLADRLRSKRIHTVVGIESRGFILAAPVATALGCAFVPVRKPGKLPRGTVSESYSLEYGTDTLQVHQDAFPKGARVAVIDDVLATGGTARATCNLIEKAGGKVVEVCFLMELSFLAGDKRLEPFDHWSILEY